MTKISDSQMSNKSPFWRRLGEMLFDPNAAITEIGARRQAQVSAVFSLILAISIVLNILATLPNLGFNTRSIVPFVSAFFFLGAYALSRSRFYRAGGWIAVSALALSPFFIAITGTDNFQSLMLSFESLAYVIAVLLLSPLEFGFVVMATSLAIFLSPVIFPYAGADSAGTGGVLVTLGFLLYINSYVQRSIERARLGELQKSNQELDTLRASLETRVEERTHALEERTHQLVQTQAQMQNLLSDLDEASRLARLAHYELKPFTQTIIFNDRFYELLHTNAEAQGGYELSIAQAVERFVYPDDAPRLITDIGSIGTANMQGDLEYRLFDTNGEVRDFSFRFVVETNTKGDAASVKGAVQDITERKQAERAVRDLENLYRRAISAADAVAYARRYEDETFTFMGEGILEITGYTAAEMTPAVFDSLVEESIIHSSEQGQSEAVQQTRSGQIPQWKADYRIRAKNGRFRWVADTSIELINSEGKSTGSVGILFDITERKTIEATLKKRATELETVTKLATSIAAIQDSEVMLQTVVDLTKESFNLYHAHVYLLNEVEDTLLLTAGAGEAGQAMVAQRHSIPLGREQSLVARTVRTRQGVMVNDVSKAPDFLPNPLLPNTHSELAVPLIIGDKVLGALDVQADQIGAFDDEDVRIYTILAAQIAIALENARSNEQSTKTLRELDTLTRRLTREGWETHMAAIERDRIGYIFEADKVNLLQKNELSANETEKTFVQPVMLHGEQIGQVVATDAELDDEELQAVLGSVSQGLSAHLENLRLTEQAQLALWETRKRTNELALINHVVSSVASSLDLAYSLQIVADELAQLLFVEQVAIALLDETGTTLTVVAEHHSNPDSISAVGFQIPLEGNTLTQQVIATRQMVVVLDAQNNPLTEPIREAVRQRLIEALYILPILVGNQVIGTVGIDILEPERVINDEELHLAQTIIFQAATAIQNSRLFEQTQAVLAETQKLYDLTARLNGVSSLQELLEASAAPAVQDGAAVASLWLLEVDEHGLPEWSTLVTNWRKSSTYSGGLPVNTRLPVRASSSSQLWINQPNVPVFVSNIQDDDRVDEVARNIFRQAQVGSSIFMPLAFGTQWLGLIVVSWSEPRSFSERDHRLYRSLTVQTAVVLNNQLLLQQTQQNAERLARLSEIQTRLSQSLDESGILNAITQLIRVDPTLSISFSYLKLDEQAQPQDVEITAMWQQGASALLDVPTSYHLKDFPISQLWINNPNEVLFISDLSTDTRVDINARETLVQVGVKAIALMPLYAVGEWQGLVSMQWPDPRAFTSDEEFFLRQLQRPLSSVVASRRAYLAAQAARHETEQRVAELAVINQVAESVSQQLDVRQLFITVHEQVRRIMPADGFVVALYDEQEHLISFPFIYDDGEYYQQAGAPPDPQSRSYQVITSGEPILLNFTPEEVAEFETQQRPTVGKPQLPSALIYVPLRIGARIIGAMSVQNYQGRHYTQTNTTILMGIANHVAVAMENSRLFTQTQQRAGELATINEISQVASSELSLDSLIEGLGNKIIQTFRASGGYIAVYDKQTNLIDMPFFIDSASEGQTRIFLPPLRLGEGITSRIIQTRQPLLVVEGTEERLQSMGAQLTGDGEQPNAFLGVPMVVGDEVVGAISIQNMPNKPPFTEADQRLLTTIAPTVGVAIQNARLFEQTQRRAEREQLVNAITQKIQGAVTVESALQTAIHELGQALRVKQARVIIAPQSMDTNGENGRN